MAASIGAFLLSAGKKWSGLGLVLGLVIRLGMRVMLVFLLSAGKSDRES
jgi:hypothetical protein